MRNRPKNKKKEQRKNKNTLNLNFLDVFLYAMVTRISKNYILVQLNWKLYFPFIAARLDTLPQEYYVREIFVFVRVVEIAPESEARTLQHVRVLGFRFSLPLFATLQPFNEYRFILYHLRVLPLLALATPSCRVITATASTVFMIYPDFHLNNIFKKA